MPRFALLVSEPGAHTQLAKPFRPDHPSVVRRRRFQAPGRFVILAARRDAVDLADDVVLRAVAHLRRIQVNPVTDGPHDLRLAVRGAPVLDPQFQYPHLGRLAQNRNRFCDEIGPK